MRLPITSLLDELGRLLLASPEVIGKYERSDPSFPEAVFRWLGDAESLLAQFSIPQVAAVSALKGKLLASSDGVLDTSMVLQLPALRSRRRARLGMSALVFNLGQELLGGLYTSMMERREEALKYIGQMLSVLQQQGAIPSTDSAGRSQALSRLFTSMNGNTMTMAAARHVTGLVSYADALRLIDETLTEWGLEP